MSMSMGNYVLFVMAVLFVGKSSGCSCLPGGALSSEYCFSELVFRGLVVNVTRISTPGNILYDRILYDVELTRVYKTSELSQSIVDGNEFVFLDTPVYGSLCGAALTDGVEYLFVFDKWAILYSGPHTIGISLCDWRRRYDDVDSLERQALDEGRFEC